MVPPVGLLDAGVVVPPPLTEAENSAEAASQEPLGVIDVHSGSTAIGLDGTAYNTW